jgi:hypothetical protein
MYALPSLLCDRLGEAASGTAVLELKELQVNPLLGQSDLLHPLIEGLRTVAE